jgi:hypothetical protein
MPHSQSTFGLVEPFDVDHGELAGMTAKEAFCLGVEWQVFRDLLPVRRGAFEDLVHAGNGERLLALCARHGRKAVLHAHGGDWTLIAVSRVCEKLKSEAAS